MPPISRRRYEMGMPALHTAVHCCCCCCISAPRRIPFQSIDMGLRHCTSCSGFPTLARAQREVALLAVSSQRASQPQWQGTRWRAARVNTRHVRRRECVHTTKVVFVKI